MDISKVIWTNKSKEQLKIIYNHYKVVSPQGAKNSKDSILKAGRELVFAEQYQQDEIELEFRRIIVRYYKLIYTVEEYIIWILRIFDCRKDPKSRVTEK
ncbi:type II toxin-antitoxin system RelE/ParE family toxin [Flavobacterium sp. ACAM 123]|uniref:type II toxin-antitoxin system RelE/ParE family toxin n=1 Tax=Flavobacterium sp. ACAM 123 TaxID=1189620 RepID=UPI0002F4E608|nr:type II toxin-antitoxin system RelE/ParE family toxin [Flavobacterium sp. ACAM 123]